MARILLVEDDLDLCQATAHWLENEGHIVQTAHDGIAAREQIEAFGGELVILDWELPGISGVELLRDLRARGKTIPVIMLTGRRTIGDKEAGLDTGADDYLTKPFELRELSVRVKALLRRFTRDSSQILNAGNLSLDPVQHRVCQEGIELELMPREFALLEFLIRHPNQVFSTEALLARVWQTSTNSSTDAVRKCANGLRHKIAQGKDAPTLRTLHGVGYRLEVR